MALKNQWVGYISRGYEQIKKSLLSRLGETNPEITDHSESNILVIIIDMFSGIGEQLNYYIDNMARESFISTARRYSSIVKLTRLIDYRIKAAIPASVDLTISLPTEPIFKLQGQDEFFIPAGTKFSTNNGIDFISVADLTINSSGNYKLPLSQKEFVDNAFIGNTTGSFNQSYSLGKDYVHNSLLLSIGGQVWERQETLGRSGPLDKHYIVEVSENKVANIIFGDNINGAVPEGNQEIRGDYYITQGKEGNVNANTIVNTEFVFGDYIDNQDITITNELSAVSGTDYENIERIRRSAPLSLRTLDRAVTKQDFIDIAKLSPGVDKVDLSYKCGEKANIYISPNGGGIAQTALINSTTNYINERRTLNTRIRVLASGESEIYLEISATAKFRRDGISTANDITNALLERYSYENSGINSPIRTSDIIALVDNLEKVDYLSLDKIYLIPYFRSIEHSKTLLKVFKTLQNSNSIIHWELKYYGNNFKLFKERAYEADVNIGEEYIDKGSNFSITINDNNYQDGQTWEFTTYPYNKNIETDDFTVPILKTENLKLSVTEQLIQN